jgi:hypothetical protein
VVACSRHDLAIAILAAAPKHQSSKFVFRTFIDGTGIDHDRVGSTGEPCICRCHRDSSGSLRPDRSDVWVSEGCPPSYQSSGFDASAHIAKETHNAAMSGPIGIITAIGVSAILGWFLILSLLFSIQDYGTTVASPAGQPVTQIFVDTVEKKGAIVPMVSNVS